MTLVEAIQNLTQIVTQMAQQQGGTGMTPEQSQQLAQAAADMAALRESMSGLQASQQTVIGSLTTHTEQLSSLSQQLQTNGANDAKLLAAIGDLSGFAGQ